MCSSEPRYFKNLDDVKKLIRAMRPLYVYETHLGPVYLTENVTNIGLPFHLVFRDQCVAGASGTIDGMLDTIAEGCEIGFDDVENIAELNIPSDLSLWQALQEDSQLTRFTAHEEPWMVALNHLGIWEQLPGFPMNTDDPHQRWLQEYDAGFTPRQGIERYKDDDLKLE
jgi:hypothetical protein